MKKANVSIRVYTKISNKTRNPRVQDVEVIEKYCKLYSPLSPNTSFLFESPCLFYVSCFFPKETELKKDNLMVQTNMSFAFNHLLSIEVRMRFTTEFNPKKISGRNGWIRNRSSQHVSYLCFFKGIKQNYTYSLYRYIQKVFFLGDQERSIKYAIPFKITRVFTLPI